MCRVSFGATFYFASAPTRDEILRAYSVYRKICPPERRTLVTTVRTPLFGPLAANDQSHIFRLLAHQDLRRDEGIVVWDGKVAQQWTFWMQGWVGQPETAPTASFCQILLPEDTDPDTLYALVRALAEELPLLSGHAGYTAQFDGQLKAAAFNQIFAWAKRYLGLEVEDLRLTLPGALDGIKGANWLTLIGARFWDRLLADPRRPRQLPEGVTLESLNHAHLFRAGRQPVLGDRNRRQFPTEYAAVERLLQPLKLKEHPEFAGRFAQDEQTLPWLRRLLEPAAW